jgi:toxin secretion/phage lysis holin
MKYSQPSILRYPQILITVFGGFVGWFLGDFNGFLYTLAVFAALDYITGVIQAVFTKTLSSQVGLKGIIRKLFIFILVGVGHIIDTQLLGEAAHPVRTLIIFFFIGNEGISLLENIEKLGIPIPEKLKAILAQFKSRSDKP